MPVVKEKFITRKMLRENRDRIYIFGDNLERWGLGGQAREMRGEPNAVGFPTKHSPGEADKDFLKDGDLERVQNACKYDVRRCFKHLSEGKILVVPSDSIGTGLARLTTYAPKILEWYEELFRGFEYIQAPPKGVGVVPLVAQGLGNADEGTQVGQLAGVGRGGEGLTQMGLTRGLEALSCMEPAKDALTLDLCRLMLPEGQPQVCYGDAVRIARFLMSYVDLELERLERKVKMAIELPNGAHN